jgi:hypothetical protein
MIELYALMEHLGDDAEEETIEEYRQLLGPMVAEFEPLVRKLAWAGLFTLDIGEGPLADAEEFSEVSYDVCHVFNNGNIWLCAGTLSSGKPIKSPPPPPPHQNN